MAPDDDEDDNGDDNPPDDPDTDWFYRPFRGSDIICLTDNMGSDVGPDNGPDQDSGTCDPDSSCDVSSSETPVLGMSSLHDFQW
jgi:hypothetical protein